MARSRIAKKLDTGGKPPIDKELPVIGLLLALGGISFLGFFVNAFFAISMKV